MFLFDLKKHMLFHRNRNIIISKSLVLLTTEIKHKLLFIKQSPGYLQRTWSCTEGSLYVLSLYCTKPKLSWYLSINLWNEHQIPSNKQWTLDEDDPLDVIYLDFAKAFDKVPHKRLIKKLEAHGISGNVSRWIKNWLKDRRQRVNINGKTSTGRMC